MVQELEAVLRPFSPRPHWGCVSLALAPPPFFPRCSLFSPPFFPHCLCLGPFPLVLSRALPLMTLPSSQIHLLLLPPLHSKLHCFGAHELETQLPQLPSFARILRRLDPPGTFTNDYVARLVLGGLVLGGVN